MTTPVYVSAIYTIYDNAYNDVLWERLKQIPTTVYLFCDPSDACKAEALPNVIPFYKPIKTFATYKILKNTKRLPQHRNPEKDTKLYMILMNAKTECLELVRMKVYASHYVWIDAGIGKILSNPSVLERACIQLNHSLRDDTIFIPGCWAKKPVTHDQIHWRFCGGFFIVPHDYVKPFFIRALNACSHIAHTHDIAIWEVNVWAAIEHLLPIQWEAGDHNDSMFRNIINYLHNNSFSTSLRLTT